MKWQEEGWGRMKIKSKIRETLWDTSWLVDNNSIVGKLLHITIGYDSKPNGMQIIFYFSSIMLTLIMMKIRTFLTKSKYA